MSFGSVGWGLAITVAGLVPGFVPGPATAQDPRIGLVELQLAGKPKEALAELDDLTRRDPEAAKRLGLPYLRGHLLLLLDRRQEAFEAFAQTLVATPELEGYARYRLAVEQAQLGHPEVAAGLLATLLARRPPAALVPAASRALRQAIEAGGDCRLLAAVPALDFEASDRRELKLTAATCAGRTGEPSAAESRRVALLEESTSDEPARLAAEALVAAQPEPTSARAALVAGLAFHDHREFERAIDLLARGLVLPDVGSLPRTEVWEARYALARSQFWLERFAIAGPAFGAIAAEAPDPERRSRALYQQARCLELTSDWTRAIDVFGRAAAAAPSEGWADAATVSRIRLEWKLGQEAAALGDVEALLAARHDESGSRALVFLAVSDLVQGRADRARAWLARVARLDTLSKPELAYWQGRAEEAAGNAEAAVGRYLAALAEDPLQPFARAARSRLAGRPLVAVAERVAAHLAGSPHPADLHVAWRVLGNADPRGVAAHDRLVALLRADPATRPYLELSLRPIPLWRLWGERLDGAEDRLLALGLFGEAGPVVRRYFPPTDPNLAFTGSLLLAQAGEHRPALLLAEVLAKRVPDRLPSALLPPAFERLLYPFPYAGAILREARRRGIDPYLLAAVIREESRFDPRAFSAASARGLAQFVLPTARRIAASARLPADFHPDHLEDPEVSIALGAAYLQELGARFGGAVEAIVAAYNAGEPQAELWRRYCYSQEPEEYLSKIAFKETRHYVRRVLASRAHYLDLYAGVAVDRVAPGVPETPAQPGGAPRRRTSGGAGAGG